MQTLNNLFVAGRNDSLSNTSMKYSEKSTKKLSVLLPLKLHKRSKRQALINDQSLTDLIISLLNNYLDSTEAASQNTKE